MISTNLNEFYLNWNSKINSIDDSNLSGVYDKFITFFIIYNNLYNEVTIKLKNKGHRIPQKVYDSTAATQYVVDYLTPNYLWNILESNNSTDILAIINILENKIFFIKLKNGTPQEQKDFELLESLKSNSKKRKCMAIMQVIYYVRCNMFHGQKGFKEYQRLIIEPLNNILKTVNNNLYQKLS